mgnify:CR=1 FL=1
MNSFSKLTLTDAIKGLQNKEFSSLELTNYFIQEIERNKNLNCYITQTFDLALKMAKLSDKKIQYGERWIYSAGFNVDVDLVNKERLIEVPHTKSCFSCKSNR